MSTILKALKKAEQESPDPEDSNRSTLKQNVRTILNSRIRHQRQGFPLSEKGRIFFLGVMLVIASASYFLLLPDMTVQPGPVIEKKPIPQLQDIKKKEPLQMPQPISKPVPKKNEIFPLKDEILNLQAISWAKNPSGRIAVINTKIVGEGESVQGYRIVEIGQDEVILGLADQKFRLIFKYR